MLYAALALILVAMCADGNELSGRQLLSSAPPPSPSRGGWYNYCDTFNGPVCATCQLQPEGFDPCTVRRAAWGVHAWGANGAMRR